MGMVCSDSKLDKKLKTREDEDHKTMLTVD